MKKLLLLLALPAAVCVAWGQASTPEAEKELATGRIEHGRHDYEAAAKHFKKAIKLEHDECSECYVWLVRSEIGMNKLSNALKNADRALGTAHSDRQRANAQLYRGVIFHRMAASDKDKLKDAEEAFRAAVNANAECAECKFDLGLVLLKEGKDSEGIEVLQGVLPEYKNDSRERVILRFVADPGRARKQFAPEFSAKLSTGEEINLDVLQGKVVLLDFWGVWCRPCRDSVPVLRELAGKVDTSKVAIISIDEGDSQEKWASFVKQNKMTWGQVYDEDHSLMETFAVPGFPSYFLLSKDGIILRKFSGWSHGELSTLTMAIESALKE